MSSEINNNIIKALYKFLLIYYNNDKILADSIVSSFLDLRTITDNENISPDIFFNILGYMQKISNDQLICFNAGRHFMKNELVQYYSIFRFDFSIKKKYQELPDIVESVFPFISISSELLKTGHLELIIQEKDKNLNTNIYFYNFLQGIVSAVPELWDFPFANTVIKTFPFHIEKIFQDLDILFQKKDTEYYLYDKKIAYDKETTGGNNGKIIQIITDDVFLKDIFLNKKTILNSNVVAISATWNTSSLVSGIFNIFFSFAGIAAGIILYFLKIVPPVVLLTLFILYYMLLFLIKSRINFITERNPVF